MSELYHYGVLGMKWGVRKGNYTAVHDKSMSRLNKYDQRAKHHSAKVQAKQAKLDAYNKTGNVAKRQMYAKKAERAGAIANANTSGRMKYAKTQKTFFRKHTGRKVVGGLFDYGIVGQAQINRYQKQSAKAAKLERKAQGNVIRRTKTSMMQKSLDRSANRYDRQVYKAEKWATKMDKNLRNTPVSKSKDYQQLTKKYLNR